MTVSRLLLLVATVASVAFARFAYHLPGGAETILTEPLETTFSCDERQYGYYADMDNNCEVFHVCFPIIDDDGVEIEMAHFSFVCNNKTSFDQSTLSCTDKTQALDCQEAEAFYDIKNSEFGLATDAP